MDQQHTKLYIYMSTGILYFVSSTVNPILYNVMSARYRKAFHDTLHTAFRCRRGNARGGDRSQCVNARNRPACRLNSNQTTLTTGPPSSRRSTMSPAEQRQRSRSASAARSNQPLLLGCRQPVRAMLADEVDNDDDGSIRDCRPDRRATPNAGDAAGADDCSPWRQENGTGIDDDDALACGGGADNSVEFILDSQV